MTRCSHRSKYPSTHHYEYLSGTSYQEGSVHWFDETPGGLVSIWRVGCLPSALKAEGCKHCHHCAGNPLLAERELQHHCAGNPNQLAGVSFAYPARLDVLTGLSLDISAETSVAYWGPRGIGKSTVIQLFKGCLRPARAVCSGWCDLQRDLNFVVSLTGTLFPPGLSSEECSKFHTS
jgi:hypothetical protein